MPRVDLIRSEGQRLDANGRTVGEMWSVLCPESGASETGNAATGQSLKWARIVETIDELCTCHLHAAPLQ
jgi:hypothetical protein